MITVKKPNKSSKSAKCFTFIFLLTLLTTGGCAKKSSDSNVNQTESGQVTSAYRKYFGDPKQIDREVTYYVIFYPYSGSEPFLAGKVKPIAKETDRKDDLPELAVSKLLQDPPLNENQLKRIIDPATEFLGMRIKKNIAEVNFSKQLLNSYTENWADAAIIASLTNTLCQFLLINGVSIEIEGRTKGEINGQKIEDFLGHISLSDQPFKPNPEVIVTQTQEDAILTVRNFLKDVKQDKTYQYLSKNTRKDVGTEKEFKSEKKTDLRKIILDDHGTWVGARITNAKFQKNEAWITITGNRTINGEVRPDDQADLVLLKEKTKWKIDFTEASEVVPPGTTEEEIVTGPAEMNRNQLEQIQAIVDQGQQPWRLDPQAVAQAEGGVFGFNKAGDVFTLVTKLDVGQLSGTGEALVEVGHNGTAYQIFLIQPIKQGQSGIWTIAMVRKK